MGIRLFAGSAHGGDAPLTSRCTGPQPRNDYRSSTIVGAAAASERPFVIPLGATLPSTLAKYADAVAAFGDGRRRRFYETLAHNLTVCVRAIWADERLLDAQQVEQMKWLNEIQHRVIGKLRAAEPWPDTEFFEEVLGARTAECPPVRGRVGWAVKQSYEYAAEQSAAQPAIGAAGGGGIL